jgi:hypothetical protein
MYSAFIFAFIATAFARPGKKDVDVNNVEQTYYGYPDNDPPGAGIAYQCGRGLAGGTGTYDDPITLATADGELDLCEVIYSCHLRKYLRHEDLCEQCASDWNQGIWHVDVWVGSSDTNGGQDQINCEDTLTVGNQDILRNPPSNLPVDSEYFPFLKCLRWKDTIGSQHVLYFNIYVRY